MAAGEHGGLTWLRCVDQGVLGEDRPWVSKMVVRSVGRRPSSQIGKGCMNKWEVGDQLANRLGLDETMAGEVGKPSSLQMWKN